MRERGRLWMGHIYECHILLLIRRKVPRRDGSTWERSHARSHASLRSDFVSEPDGGGEVAWSQVGNNRGRFATAPGKTERVDPVRSVDIVPELPN